MLNHIKDRILQGGHITKTEARALWDEDLISLAASANEIREYFCGNTFDLCSIINGKSGKCSENCAYCAQSIHHQANISTYDLLDKDIIIKEATHNAQKGVHRFSIVTSGRALTDEDLILVTEIDQVINESCNIFLCASHGLLSLAQFSLLKSAGVKRYHNNIETSRRYFPTICTTHTFDDKLQAIQYAREAGLDICSGGIIGMGETIEDRIDLAITLRELHVTSIPINILTPIPGTPFENLPILQEDDIIRCVALFRFINPKAMIRLAGGRGNCQQAGKHLFFGGANAAITGDMLTTQGISIDRDKAMLKELGYHL